MFILCSLFVLAELLTIFTVFDNLFLLLLVNHTMSGFSQEISIVSNNSGNDN